MAIDKMETEHFPGGEIKLQTDFPEKHQERSKFKIQEALTKAFRDISTDRVLQRFTLQRSEQEEQRVEQTFSSSATSTNLQYLRRAHSSTNR